MDAQIKAIKAIKTKVGIEYTTVAQVNLGKNSTIHQFKTQANRMQDEFDRDSDPVRVYVFEDDVPVFAARSAKADLCRIKQMTDGGVYGKAA